MGSTVSVNVSDVSFTASDNIIIGNIIATVNSYCNGKVSGNISGAVGGNASASVNGYATVMREPLLVVKSVIV